MKTKTELLSELAQEMENDLCGDFADKLRTILALPDDTVSVPSEQKNDLSYGFSAWFDHEYGSQQDIFSRSFLCESAWRAAIAAHLESLK